MAIIHLLDDDTAITQACAFLLESPGCEVSYWKQGEKFLAEVNLHQADILLPDTRMSVLDGYAVHEIVRQKAGTLAVVFLIGHGDVLMAAEQMKHGAVGFLQKPVSAAPLQTALEHALQVSAAALPRQEIISCYQQLTPKERELAYLVAEGLMNWEIAGAMNIAVRTIEMHWVRVMGKMQAGSLTEPVNRLQRVQQNDDIYSIFIEFCLNPRSGICCWSELMADGQKQEIRRKTTSCTMRCTEQSVKQCRKCAIQDKNLGISSLREYRESPLLASA